MSTYEKMNIEEPDDGIPDNTYEPYPIEGVTEGPTEVEAKILVLRGEVEALRSEVASLKEFSANGTELLCKTLKAVIGEIQSLKRGETEEERLTYE